MQREGNKECSEKEMCRGKEISLLKDVKIRKQYEEKFITLVDVEAPYLLEHFKDGMLKKCDEVCGKKRGRRSKVDIWWRNEEMMEADSRKKDAYNAMYWNSTEEKWRHKSMKNKARKAVSKTIREKAEEALTE